MTTIATITKDGVEIGKLELVKSCGCSGCIFCYDECTDRCAVEGTPLSAVCRNHIWQVANG